MSHEQDLIDNGYTKVVVTGNPPLNDELEVVARGEPAMILASDRNAIKEKYFVDGIQSGGQVAILDDPSEELLVDLKGVSR